MQTWRATVKVMAHSTGEGALKDAEACGGTEMHFETQAASFDEALGKVAPFCRGIKTNPRVWQVEITALARA